MKFARAVVSGSLLSICALAGSPAGAQQFNSDSYISKPHGMVTSILTTGEHTTMFMMTFSLFPNWELTAAGYFFNTDADRKTAEGTQGSLYAKYMFYENEAKTGGFAVKGGTGMKPSYILDGVGFQSSSQSWWMNSVATIPFFDNKLSWDIQPGFSVTPNAGGTENDKWAFTYSTRLAWYPKGPVWAIVGEAFGATGEAYLDPEYNVGLRYEPNAHVNIALTYGAKFNGSTGQGFQIGVMLFSPPFLCFSGCK
jgi:hypothetical protein